VSQQQRDDNALAGMGEQELARRIDLGDDDARNELMRRSLPLVAHVARRLGIRLTDDLRSDCHLVLVKAVPGWDAERMAWPAYACMCIRREIARDRAYRRSLKTLPDAPLPDPRQDPRERAETRECAAWLLERLDPRSRRVLKAFYWDGLPLKGCAEREHLSYPATRRLFDLAHRELQEAWSLEVVG
jgi:RNA polymerase sigma factor (sigma-70 family)